MNVLWPQLLILGISLTVLPSSVLALEHTITPPDPTMMETLRSQFEQRLKAQLSQKPLAEYSYNDIFNLALKASEQVYGRHPELMKQKVLFELQQLPSLQQSTLSRYSLKTSLNIAEFSKESETDNPALGQTLFGGMLPLFYRSTPAEIAQTLKQVIVSQHQEVEEIGQRAILSRFLPDQTYRVKGANPTTIAVKTFENDLFVFTFQLTESGLLNPIQMNWMSPRLER